MTKLTAQGIKKLGDGRHNDGGSMFLHVRGASRAWVYRYQKDGKRRDMQLGRHPEMSLKDARIARADAVKALRDGVELRRVRTEQRSQTLRSWVGRWLKANRHDLKDSGRSGRWLSPVKVHVIPKLGDMDIRALDFSEIKAVFDPIWRTKTSAAAKGLDRLGKVMRYAETELPELDTRIVPRVRVALGNQRHKVTNIPSMDWQDVLAFYATLDTSAGALAMRLLILTASRGTPVRLAHIGQFDGDTWVIPAANMKSSREFRIPLSDEAQRVVDLARPLARNGFLFCGPRGKPISDMTMAAILKRRGLPYRPHGFRASFKTWAEVTAQDWTLAEMSLDHLVGNKVERTYQRSDLLDRRREVMQRWSEAILNLSDERTGV